MSAIRRFRQFLVLLLVAALAAQTMAMTRGLPCHQGGRWLGSTAEPSKAAGHVGVNHVHQSEAAGSHHQHAAAVDVHHQVPDGANGDGRDDCAACASCGLCTALIPAAAVVLPPSLVALLIAAGDSPPPQNLPDTFDRPPRA